MEQLSIGPPIHLRLKDKKALMVINGTQKVDTQNDSPNSPSSESQEGAILVCRITEALLMPFTASTEALAFDFNVKGVRQRDAVGRVCSAPTVLCGSDANIDV